MWHINDTIPVDEELVYYAYYDDETDKSKLALDLRKLSGFTDDEDPYMVVVYNVKEFNNRYPFIIKNGKVFSSWNSTELPFSFLVKLY
jgi:hypothetical protein